MIAALYCVAAAMILGGVYAALTGWEYVIIERGWTQVLVGSMAATGGVLLAGLATLVGAVRRVEKRLAESVTAGRGEPQMREPSVRAAPAVRPTPSAEKPLAGDDVARASGVAASAAGALAAAAALASTTGSVARPESREPLPGSGASPDGAPSLEPLRPEAKLEETVAASTIDAATSEENVDNAEKSRDDQTEAAAEPDIPEEPGASAETEVSPADEEEADADEPVASAADDATTLGPAEEGVGETDGSDALEKPDGDGNGRDVLWADVDEPLSAPLPPSRSAPEALEPGVEPADASEDESREADFAYIAPEAPKADVAPDIAASDLLVEPEFGTPIERRAGSDIVRADAEHADDVADQEPPQQDAPKDHALDDGAPMEDTSRDEAYPDEGELTDVAPSPAPATVPPSVIGTYESGANVYTMYSDGSIDALTPDGEFHFASLDELKIFIAEGGEDRGA